MSRAALSIAPTINNSPALNTFVVYAAQDITLGTADHSVGGDIGVATTTGSAAQIVVGGLTGLDPSRNLYAPSVLLGGAAVVGDIETNALTNSGGLFNAQAPYPGSAMPPVPAILPPTPGGAGITVVALQSQTLSPGSYGALVDNGTVLLNPGTYSFASIALGTGAQLLAQPGGSTTVLVAGAFAAGPLTHILPVAQGASKLTISVAATDAAGGSQPAVSIGDGSQITALPAAPNGTLSLGNAVQATGAFAGLNVSVGNGAALTFECGFPIETPAISTFVAYAARSVTLGVGDHSLGGDIGVAAAAPSSFGTQLTVGNLAALDPARDLFAPTVALGSLATIGDVETNALTNSGGLFNAQTPYPAAAMPPVPLAQAASPGTSSVTVAVLQTQTLTPGGYGALTDNGILVLAPGVYSFASVNLGPGAQLLAQPGGPTTIGVAGSFTTGVAAQIAPVVQTAGSLSISVAGSDDPSGIPVAVAIGAGSHVTCLLAATHGTLSLGDGTLATGAFAAFDISAGQNVTLVFQTGFAPAGQQPLGPQQLSGYITPAIETAPLVGPVPQSTVITLAIGLPVQTPTGGPDLATFVRQVSDPASPTFRQFLTESQFDSTYGPTVADYATLSTFVQTGGLTIVNTYGNRTLLDVSGTAGQVEQMLYVGLNYYLRPDGSQFYAPDREPSTNLTVPVLRVAGLDNYAIAKPAVLPGSGSGGNYLGSDFRRAYVPCTTGV
ncbi:MAG: protease pro-enzyme activation domain-containing protein, partial [Polyangiaceae bacterium]